MKLYKKAIEKQVIVWVILLLITLIVILAATGKLGGMMRFFSNKIF